MDKKKSQSEPGNRGNRSTQGLGDNTTGPATARGTKPPNVDAGSSSTKDSAEKKESHVHFDEPVVNRGEWTSLREKLMMSKEQLDERYGQWFCKASAKKKGKGKAKQAEEPEEHEGAESSRSAGKGKGKQNE